ncbi:UDP-glycosyltransferase 76F1-like [Syzygium oleosum]|uniref:UDP-glycosyltransferase 76F1-like n=1 Tax=Syzygium oleosum TaxID=219896 RepID=UPI0011D2A6E5|nr:UDP-glycosyltransferase 76F1-like [Syzygium oleosum]
MNQRNNHRLVLFPLPFQGHMNPMLQLGRILYTRGFSITILHTNFNAPDPSSHPHFAFRSIANGLDRSEASTLDIPRLVSLLNARCASPFEECLREMMPSPGVDAVPVACLISDQLFSFMCGVAERLKVRALVLRTGGAASLYVYTILPVLKEKGYVPTDGSRSEEAVKEFPPLLVRDIPVVDSQKPEMMFRLFDNLVKVVKSSTGVIFNTFEELEHPALTSLREVLSVPVFPIGPFHKCCVTSSSSSLLAEDRSCISWLDEQPLKSVIYVSFGSSAAVSNAEILEIALGLADSQQPFLLVVRPGSVGDPEWPEKSPSHFLKALEGRGKIVKWAPQVEVLAHPAVGAFWTHNGWNSTVESISEGVPMLCMPCFADQGVNARYVSDVWGVGVHLNGGLERENIARAIKRVLVEREGEETRQRALVLKEKASGCLTPGGSSYRGLDGLVNHILRCDSEDRLSALEVSVNLCN